MPDFITLSCPSCGGKLQITNDIDRFACAHCGTEHIVKRGGGLVSLAPVVAEIKHVSAGVERTASELAIKRLEGEIAELEEQKSKAGGGGCSLFLLPAVILCGALALLSSIEDDLIMILGIGLASVVAIVVFFVLLSKAQKEDATRKAPIEERIQAKREQLAKHKELVSTG